MRQIRTLEELRAIIPNPHPLVAAKIIDRIDKQAAAFIAASPLVVVASSGTRGIELSPKGDEAGFVRLQDDRTLIIPERPGNRLALGLQNILENDAVGLAFFVPGTMEVLRVIGRATLWDDDALNATFGDRRKPALMTIRVDVERAYFHCARPIKRSRVWEPESWSTPMEIAFHEMLKANVRSDELAVQLADMAKKEDYRKLW